jgi:hypothetical protein
MNLLGKRQTLGRVHEPAVVAAAGHTGVAGLVAEQRHGQRIHREGVDQVGLHQGRGVVHAVQDPHQRRADVFGALEASRGVVADEDEEMVAFVEGQSQRPGESRGDLDGGLRSTLLFQPGVVVGGHAGELRDLLAAQPLRTPARPLDQPDVPGAQHLTPAAQELRQPLLVHAPILTASGPPTQRPPIRG